MGWLVVVAWSPPDSRLSANRVIPLLRFTEDSQGPFEHVSVWVVWALDSSFWSSLDGDVEY